MKISTIEFMQRKNEGNYEYQEIKVQVVVDENENADVVMTQVKNFVAFHLGKAIQQKVEEAPKKPTAVTDEAPVENKVEEKVEAPKKEKATKPKKAAEVKEELPPVIEEAPAPVDKSIVKYDRMTLAHSSTLSSYLTKTYGESWKKAAPPAEIKAFSESLNGQPFLDKAGNIVPSFVEQLSTFFGPK
jgi:outer membrane biosynthesis protein TonB